MSALCGEAVLALTERVVLALSLGQELVTRLPAALVVLLLHREAAAKNRPELAVTTAALWQWRRRGHIGPGPGYDLDEIMEYLKKRGVRV